MADTEQQQVPTQNEGQESEKHEGENGVGNGEQHTNGQPKGPEEGANGDASGAADETPVASSVESSPSKPKRSGGGVKSFFSHIFKRKPKEENGQSPKKKEKPKKSAKEAAKAPEQKATDAKDSDAAQDKLDQQPEQPSEQQDKSDSPAHEHKQQNGETDFAEPLMPEAQDILKIDDLKITSRTAPRHPKATVTSLLLTRSRRTTVQKKTRMKTLRAMPTSTSTSKRTRMGRSKSRSRSTNRNSSTQRKSARMRSKQADRRRMTSLQPATSSKKLTMLAPNRSRRLTRTRSLTMTAECAAAQRAIFIGYSGAIAKISRYACFVSATLQRTLEIMPPRYVCASQIRRYSFDIRLNSDDCLSQRATSRLRSTADHI